MAGIFLIFQEAVGQNLIAAPSEGAIQNTIVNLVQWLKLAIETSGALIIGTGVVIAGFEFVRAILPPQMENYNRIRLTLARYLALALEFQLGADILSTAIAPSWDQIGKLGAIAVIRTALNFFLTKEMQQERKITESGNDAPGAGKDAAAEHSGTEADS